MPNFAQVFSSIYYILAQAMYMEDSWADKILLLVLVNIERANDAR